MKDWLNGALIDRSQAVLRADDRGFTLGDGLFETMAPRPVTIRLLDPPIHEFLPTERQLLSDIERLRHLRDTVEGMEVLNTSMSLLEGVLEDDQQTAVTRIVSAETVEAALAKKQAEKDALKQKQSKTPGKDKPATREEIELAEARADKTGGKRTKHGKHKHGKEETLYGREELHVATEKSGKRKKGKVKREAHVTAEAKHGFEKPVAPITHDVTIPETITGWTCWIILRPRSQQRMLPSPSS